jgi:hypothetical protein
MTTLNGILRYWESFIKGISSIINITRFRILWEDCSHEESRLEEREEKLGNDEN